MFVQTAMLFMGQEILEDKYWGLSLLKYSQTYDVDPTMTIWWEGLESQTAMRDFLAFTKALIRLRRQYTAITSPNVNVFHVNNESRVIALYRWLEPVGEHIIVVGTLSEAPLYNYQIGFPKAGRWRQVFNSEAFESEQSEYNFNDSTAVNADREPIHSLPCSAHINIPAKGVIVFSP